MLTTYRLLSTITDFAGRTWTYDYNSVTNDLTSVTGPNTPDYPSGLATTYAYDTNHNLLSITDSNSQTFLANTYDANDMVTQQTNGDGMYTYSHNPDSNEVTVTDRRGFDSTYVYNSTGQLLSLAVDTNDLRAGDPNSYTTSYQYNSDMKVTRTTFPAGNWIDYTYDANGNVLTVCREPNNGDANIVTTYTYDPNFNFVKTKTDPLGNVTTYAYDANGNLTSITYPTVSTPTGDANAVVSFSYNSYGQVETTTAPDGIITKYQYYTDANDANNYGHLWKVIVDYNESDGNSLDITTVYEYDAPGRVIEVNDPNGDITSFEYNNLDQLTKATAPSPYSYVTNFSHNDVKKLSQVEREISGPNQITSYTYNILDKPATITDPLGYVTKNSYDNSENLSDVNDAENNVTQCDYDERDLLWKVTDANGNVTEYSYTLNGRLAEINDPNGDKTTYSYDGFDRLTCITYPDDTNETFGYDKNSNLTSIKNRNDQTIYYEYDAMNRMTVKNRPGDPNIAYRYDIASRLYDVDDGRTVANGGGVTEYYYDRVARVTDVNDREERWVSYEYDDRGLRTMLVYPDDTNVTYEYDALSRLTKVEYEGSTAAEYGYDELWRRTLLALGSDANAAYEYDLGSRLTKLTNNVSAGTSIVFDYNDYDKVGNRLNMKIDDANAHVYTYDEIYRLTFVDYNDGNSTGYLYDALGNRVDMNESGNVTDYNSNNLNQYTKVADVNYAYDENGNLTKDGSTISAYDCENRLMVSNPPIMLYRYDYVGRRVRMQRIVPGMFTIKYCYDGGQVIAEYDAANNLLRKFVYGPGIDQPICMIDVADGNTVYYYHVDGLGSVRAVSDANAMVVEKYSYDVFGEPTIYDSNDSEISETSIGNPYLFTGRRYDNESGLYYYRARYYSPLIGRFLQTDPIGYQAGLNLYRYVRNDPVNRTDPFGLGSGVPPRCLDLCTEVQHSMAHGGCVAHCGGGGSAAVSSCLIVAGTGARICTAACTLTDCYDTGHGEDFEVLRDDTYAQCGVPDKGLIVISILLSLVCMLFIRRLLCAKKHRFNRKGLVVRAQSSSYMACGAHLLPGEQGRVRLSATTTRSGQIADVVHGHIQNSH